MNRELYIHTLRMLREQYEIARMDTVVETIDAALAEFERPTDSDCISRQAAIDAVKGRFSMPVDNLIVEVIGALPSAQPEPQWIPCSERLPEEDGDYWITVDPRYVPPQYKSTDIILWSNGKWMMADYFVIDGEGRKMPEYKAVEVDIPIIAWMPLPEPWKGEINGDTEK